MSRIKKAELVEGKLLFTIKNKTVSFPVMEVENVAGGEILRVISDRKDILFNRDRGSIAVIYFDIRSMRFYHFESTEEFQSIFKALKSSKNVKV